MGYGIGFQCDHLETCPNPKCIHRKPHLSQIKRVTLGTYRSCANTRETCRYVKTEVHCERIPVKAAAR